MTEIERIKQELAKPMTDWRIRFEEEGGGDMSALVHEPIPGSCMAYGLVTMESVPTTGEDDDLAIDTAEDRVRELLLIARAPDLLRAVREAIVRLEEVTGLHAPTDEECATWSDASTDHVWRKLAEIQDALMRAEWDAIDTDAM